MKELELGMSLHVLFEHYNPIKIHAVVREAKKKGETDEELFQRTHDKLTKALEAEIGLRVGYLLANRDPDEGLIPWVKTVIDKVQNQKNEYANAVYAAYYKKNKEIEDGDTTKEEKTPL